MIDKVYAIKKFNDEEIVHLILPGEICSIPKDEGNRDYQEYLSWISEGNKPEVIE
jgi:hypothetical protein